MEDARYTTAREFPTSSSLADLVLYSPKNFKNRGFKNGYLHENGNNNDFDEGFEVSLNKYFYFL